MLSAAMSMSRVSTLFGRNEMYQEQTDLFHDDHWPEETRKVGGLDFFR